MKSTKRGAKVFEKEPDKPLTKQELLEKTQALMTQAIQVLEDLKGIIGVDTDETVD